MSFPLMPVVISSSAVVPSPQVYSTPGTYSFVVPIGVTSVSIAASGGAGGGASGWTATSGGGKGEPIVYTPQYGGDGGSAASVVKALSTTPGETLTVVVGAGGAGGTAPVGLFGVANSGATGTDSTVTQAAVVVARADAGFGGSQYYDGAGGTTAASVGDTKTAGVAGAGGAGGFGNTSAGTAGVSGSVTISW